ncbi:hypothetical protein [Gordonia humi]|uniref:Succinate-acetate transporter protein n=1 Tax=Gordonia humi TaxID=686429 RepID=A0A840F253_9ACTN|nr:hypothetical protein [Gordonia humi]MBB4135469.1 succinate-acetate transporter protein [Gordonia humi]
MSSSTRSVGLADTIGDPGGAALFTFGLALTWVFFAEVVDHAASGALVFGLLVGGLGQTLGGVIAIIRKDNYLGNLLITYGLWLIGFHLLSIHEMGSPAARGFWSFALVVPSLFLLVPAIRMRAVAIILAFVFLIALELFLGFAMLNGDIAWLGKAVGWSALASAVPIYYLGYERLMGAVTPEPSADGVPA